MHPPRFGSVLRALEHRYLFDGAVLVDAGSLVLGHDGMTDGKTALSDPGVAGSPATKSESSVGRGAAGSLQGRLTDAPYAEPAAALRIDGPVPGGLLRAAPSATEILFIDAAVPDIASLVAAVPPAVEIVVIDSTDDPWRQMTDALASHQDLEAVHIVSHGSAGEIQLGGKAYGVDALAAEGSQLADWAPHLAQGADILMYGCSIGAGESGRLLVDALARLSHADVAASTNQTAPASQGGDWVLERQSGDVGAGVLDFAASTWQGSLASVSLSLAIRPGATAAVSAGEAVPFLFEAANSGTSTLTSVSLSAPQLDAGLAPRTVTVAGASFNIGDKNLDNSLNPGETWQWSGSYTATQADIATGGALAGALAGDGYLHLTAEVRAKAGALSTSSAGSVLVELNAAPVNQRPDTSVVPLQVNEDGVLAFTGVHQLAVSDVNQNLVSTRLAVEQGVLSLVPAGAATVTAGGNGTASLTLSGNEVDISATLASLTYQGHPNFNGSDSLTMVSTDGASKPLSDVDTVTIRVISVNDAPTGADTKLTMLEDGRRALTLADFGFSDASDSPANHLLAVEISTLPESGVLSLNGVALVAGQFVPAADIGAGLLVYAAAANANGAGLAHFGFQVQDDGGTANGGVALAARANVVTLDVTPVNDAPSGADKTLTLLEDGSIVLALSDFGFSDSSDAPANQFLAVKIDTLPESGRLSLNGVALLAGQFVPAADIGAGRLVYAPAANVNGVGLAHVGFKVQDDGGTANGGVALATRANVITLDVTPVNDAPVITTASGADRGAVTENLLPTTGGTLSSSDVDAFHTATWSGDKTSGYGSFAIDPANGVWGYTLADNAAVNALSAGQQVIETFTATVTDDQGATATQTVTVTITGINDAALLSSATRSLTETNAVLTDSGTLTITDVDSPSAFRAGMVKGSYGSLVIASNGVWSYTASSVHDEFAQGQVYSDTFTVAAVDGTTTSVKIDITGTNDAALLSSATQALTETNAVLTTSGTLTVTDVDSPAAFTASAVSGRYGSLSVNSAGAWTYTASSAHDEFAQGQVYSDTFNVAAVDGTTTSVKIDITGTNDAAVLSSATRTLTETNAVLTDSGTLSITDVDSSETFKATTVSGSYGSLTIASSGAWTYTASSAHDELIRDQVYSDSFTVAAFDGTTTTVKIDITGTNDPASIGPGTQTDAQGRLIGQRATVQEDTTLTAAGKLSVADPEAGQSLFAAQAATAGVYGSFALAPDGSWRYRLDNNAAIVQALKTGQTVTDSFAVASADGTPASVVVDVQGLDGLISPNPAIYIEGLGPVSALTSTFSVPNPAAAQVLEATVTLTDAKAGESLSLSAAASGLVIAQTTPGTLVIRGQASSSVYEGLLRQISFDTASGGSLTPAAAASGQRALSTELRFANDTQVHIASSLAMRELLVVPNPANVTILSEDSTGSIKPKSDDGLSDIRFTVMAGQRLADGSIDTASLQDVSSILLARSDIAMRFEFSGAPVSNGVERGTLLYQGVAYKLGTQPMLDLSAAELQSNVLQFQGAANDFDVRYAGMNYRIDVVRTVGSQAVLLAASDVSPLWLSVRNVNDAPTAVAPEARVSLYAQQTAQINLSNLFADIDPGDMLRMRYAVSSADASVRTSLSGSQLTLQNLSASNQSSGPLTIIATDGGGLSATTTLYIDQLGQPTTANVAPTLSLSAAAGLAQSVTLVDSTALGAAPQYQIADLAGEPLRVSISEMQSPLLSVAGVDANGDTLSYTISGVDAKRFNVSADGVLQPLQTLSFESQNLFTFTLSVSDGRGGVDSRNVTLTLLNVVEPGVANDGTPGGAAKAQITGYTPSNGSGLGSILTQDGSSTVAASATDLDNVDNFTETFAADRNGDGIPDSLQSDVASFPGVQSDLGDPGAYFSLDTTASANSYFNPTLMLAQLSQGGASIGLLSAVQSGAMQASVDIQQVQVAPLEPILEPTLQQSMAAFAASQGQGLAAVSTPLGFIGFELVPAVTASASVPADAQAAFTSVLEADFSAHQNVVRVALPSGSDVNAYLKPTYAADGVTVTGFYNFTLQDLAGNALAAPDANRLMTGVYFVDKTGAAGQPDGIPEEALIYLVDNARGDDNPATGVIRDPGAFARIDTYTLGSATRQLTETNAALTDSGTLTVTSNVAGFDSSSAFTAATVSGRYGTLVIGSDGAWTYSATSAHDEFARDQVYTDVFKVAAANGVSTTVTIAITGTNDAPVGADTTLALLEDHSITLALSDFGFRDASDVPASQLLAVKISTLPESGLLSLDGVALVAGQFVSAADIAAGRLSYAAAANANGAGLAHFDFQVQDDGGTANGGVDLAIRANRLTMDVTPVNDAPAGADKTLTLLEDGSVVLALSDFGFRDASDTPANHLLAVEITTLPESGLLSLDGVALVAGQFVSAADIDLGRLSYAAAANANGAGLAHVGFQLQDDGGTAGGGVALATRANTITLDVTPVNHPPQVGRLPDGSPDPDYSLAAGDYEISTWANTAQGGRVQVYDRDGDAPIFSLDNSDRPSHGTVTVDRATGSYRYAPDAGYVGADRFSVIVEDGRGGSAKAEVAVTIKAALQMQDTARPVNAEAAVAAPLVALDALSIPIDMAADPQTPKLQSTQTGALQAPRSNAGEQDPASAGPPSPGPVQTLVVQIPSPQVDLSDTEALEYRLPGDTFASSDPKAEVYFGATLVGGELWPDWLVFNPADAGFSGVVPADAPDLLQVRIQAKDSNWQSAETVLTLRLRPVDSTPMSRAPVVRDPMGEAPTGARTPLSDARPPDTKMIRDGGSDKPLKAVRPSRFSFAEQLQRARLARDDDASPAQGPVLVTAKTR